MSKECSPRGRGDPLEGARQLPPVALRGEIPDDARCFALWRKYRMLENVQRHSLVVAKIAQYLAEEAAQKGGGVDVKAVRASALLHDIAKTWSIAHRCSHAVVGASWVIMETKSYAVAQGVLLHVNWPWPLPQGSAICQLPFFVFYADKRVRHDCCVTLDERFEDLLVRYGKSEEARSWIRQGWEQSRAVEAALGTQLGLNLATMSWRKLDQ